MKKTAISAALLLMLAACGGGGGDDGGTGRPQPGHGRPAGTLGANPAPGSASGDPQPATPAPSATTQASGPSVLAGLDAATLDGISDKLLYRRTLQDFASQHRATIRPASNDDYTPLALTWTAARISLAHGALQEEINRIGKDEHVTGFSRACGGGGTITVTAGQAFTYRIDNCVPTHARGITANGQLVSDRQPHDAASPSRRIDPGQSLHLQGTVFGAPLDVRFGPTQTLQGGLRQDGLFYSWLVEGTIVLRNSSGQLIEFPRSKLDTNAYVAPGMAPSRDHARATHRLPIDHLGFEFTRDGIYHQIAANSTRWDADQGLYIGSIESLILDLKPRQAQWPDGLDTDSLDDLDASDIAEDDAPDESLDFRELDDYYRRHGKRLGYVAASDGSIKFFDPFHHQASQVHWADAAMQAQLAHYR